MKCKKCGHTILENKPYCTLCGHLVQQKTSSKKAMKFAFITLGIVSIGILSIVWRVLSTNQEEKEENITLKTLKTLNKEIEVPIEETIPKEDDIKIIKEEWLYFSTNDGLYRAQKDGQVMTKLLNLEMNSYWEVIEDRDESSIYYTYANILYRAEIDGSNPIQLAEESVSAWEVIKDEIIGTTWLLCRAQTPFLLSLDGKTKVVLSREDIQNIIVYNNRIIYDLHSNPYTEVVQNNIIYSSDLEGEETVFLEKDKVDQYTYTNEEKDSDYGYIYLLGKDGRTIYFGIVDDMFMSVHVFKKDMLTHEIKEIYIASTPMHPYIDFSLDEKYIYLTYSEMRHYYTTVQIGINDYEVKGYGSIIGTDDAFIYKSNYEGIYKFDIKTEKETLIRKLYPMDWYTDYKYHRFIKSDDWIYFDDYIEEPIYDQYEQPADIPTYMYRINVKTGQEESLDESYKELFDDYHFAYQKRQDKEGYSYFYNEKSEKSYNIIKTKEDSKEIIIAEIKSPIQKLEVVSINIEQSINMNINLDKIVVKKGQTIQLDYNVHPIDAKVYFESDNPSRATISNKGEIAAYGKGEVTMTVTAVKEGYKRAVQTVQLTISEKESEEIE